MVLDVNGYEKLFHNTIIKPRLNIPIKDLLHPTDGDQRDSFQANLFYMIYDEIYEWFTESRKKEYDKVVGKGDVKVIDRFRISHDSNFVGNRFEFCIKYHGTASKHFKSRLILHVHPDKYVNNNANHSAILM